MDADETWYTYDISNLVRKWHGGENAIMIEIMSSNGYFFLDFVQQWQEELYFEAFCQQLTLQGIPYEWEGVEAHRVSAVELP